jgi:hypothetical protein
LAVIPTNRLVLFALRGVFEHRKQAASGCA